MLKKVVLAGALILSSISYGQLRVGVESNSQYYIDDKKIKLDISEACKDLPIYKRISDIEIREEEFVKTTTNKIKR